MTSDELQTLHRLLHELKHCTHTLNAGQLASIVDRTAELQKAVANEQARRKGPTESLQGFA